MTQEAKDYTLLFLRIIIVGIFLYHGYPKATDWGMAMSKFEQFGFPGFLGPVVGIFEVIFGIFLLLGLWTRASATVLSVIIFVAAVGVQIPMAMNKGTLLHPGLERDLLILASTLFLSLYGPGALALKTRRMPRISEPTETSR